MGFSIDEGPLGTLVTETFSCCHCQRITELADTVSGAVPARGAPRATTTRQTVNMCHHCWKRVCDTCHADGRCRPWEKQCEEFERRVREAETRAALLRSIGLE
jgi:hypothetical protein